jgi:hypothetical protein
VDAEGYQSGSDDGDDPVPAPTRISHEVIQEAQEESPINEKTIEVAHAISTDEVVQTPTTPSGTGTGDKDASPRFSRGSRPRSSSDVSAEDPEANARALKGQLVPEVVRGSIVSEEGVPPVPPLPQNLMGRNSRSSNRMRGEALAPGIPFSSVSSGRSSITTQQAHQRRSDALGSLPPVTTSTEDATAAVVAALGHRTPPSRSSAPTSPPLSSTGQKSPALAPPAHLTTRDDRPESLVAAASANAAGAAAALAAIAAAGGGTSSTDYASHNTSSDHGAYTARAPGLGLASNLGGSIPMGREPSNISSLGDAASIGVGGDVSAVGSRAGSVKEGTRKDDAVKRGNSVKGSVRSTGPAKPEKERVLGQALLGSIEVSSSDGKGIGRPPV